MHINAGYGPAVRIQAGFKQAMQVAGHTGITRFYRATLPTGYEAFNEMIPDLTTLVAMNERAIPGVMQAIADRGWRIPDDFSLVVIVSSAHMAEMMIDAHPNSDGFTEYRVGSPESRVVNPSIGRRKKDTQQVLLSCKLIIRGGSGPSRGNYAVTNQ